MRCGAAGGPREATDGGFGCNLDVGGQGNARLTRRWKRESSRETPGTKLHRTTYHYWFHLGEAQAVRQMLGHTKLPDFVGGFGKNQYRPEAALRVS